jgi:hypothetical protein
VTVNLFANRGEDLAGKTIVIDAARKDSPRITLRWKDEGGHATTESLTSGYAMRIEFGPVTGKQISGKIYLAAPDAEKSFVSGNFLAEIRKPSPKK